jgi:hypothetical protein
MMSRVPLGCTILRMREGLALLNRDCILKCDLSSLAIQGLRRFLEDHDGHDERLNGPIESWAFLYFQLRQAEDTPEWFPFGEWATIQRLEAVLTETA